jgi:putative heme-binding domain-containing protein
VLTLFEDVGLWRQRMVQETILERLMQRYTMAGQPQDFAACARMLQLAPSAKEARLLLNGLQEGLRGRDVTDLPIALVKALQPYQAAFQKESLALALRQGQPEAVEQALATVANDKAPLSERLAYIRILGEINQPASVPVLLGMVEKSQSSGAIKQAALQALQRYDEAQIGEKIVEAYPNRLRADPHVRQAALALFASRPAWAQLLLDAIEKTRKISEDDVPEQLVRRLKLLNDPAVVATADRLWPQVRLANSSEKEGQMAQVSQALKAGPGDPVLGRPLFESRCGNCHRLFDRGGSLGPDLSGYDRSNLSYLLFNIVDPNADIREGYVNYHVTTVDGRALVGTITARSGGTITLQPLGEESITLAAGQIKEMKAQQTSLMPERLLDNLTDEQIRNLFAYLMKKN